MKNLKQFLKEALEEFTLDENQLSNYFDEFNKKYFNGILDKPKLSIINNPSEKFLGTHSFNIDYINEKIQCKEIIINLSKIHTTDEFRNVLVHEMIHNYVNLKEQPKQAQWDVLNTQFTYEELYDIKNQKEIYEILNITENQKHKGLWKKMVNDLNIKNDELNIEEYKGHFIVDEDYIKRYINKFAVYYVNQSLFVLDKADPYFTKCNDLIKRGTCKIPMYEGDWYELELTKDPYLFGLFIKFNNFTKAYRYKLTETQFKMFEHNGCYKSKFLGTVKVSITEQHKWSLKDLSLEEKRKLTEFSIEHPYMEDEEFI